MLHCFIGADLRQELAVRERQSDVSRMSAPSSPTQDNDKMDSAVQASLSLPATPLSKGLDNAFANPTGSLQLLFLLFFLLPEGFSSIFHHGHTQENLRQSSSNLCYY